MKIKYFLLYVFVGIAFLAVSAWVFFSRGKSAKAIRAKYRLGGIMLMCMAMLSVASCGQIFNPGVTCYDPAPEYYFAVTTGKHDANWKYILYPGAVLTVQIECHRYQYWKYGIVLSRDEDMTAGEVLQTACFDAEGKTEFQYELSYDPADKAYAGTARVDIYGYPEGEEDGVLLYSNFLLVTTGED